MYDFRSKVSFYSYICFTKYTIVLVSGIFFITGMVNVLVEWSWCLVFHVLQVPVKILLKFIYNSLVYMNEV